jgi:hypothetical protein
LIVAGGTGTDDVITQSGIERLAAELGEFVHERFGLGIGREDAADRCQGEGTEPDGAFQSGTHVVAWIV